MGEEVMYGSEKEKLLRKRRYWVRRREIVNVSSDRDDDAGER